MAKPSNRTKAPSSHKTAKTARAKPARKTTRAGKGAQAKAKAAPPKGGKPAQLLVLAKALQEGHDYTAAGFAAAGAAAGYDAASLRRAFPLGLVSFMDAFCAYVADETTARMRAARPAPVRVQDKIRGGVMAWLSVIAPWQDTMAMGHGGGRALIGGRRLPSFTGMMPDTSHSLALLGAPRRLWRIADAIWWEAGDTATDYNHYTKRLILSYVLTACGFYQHRRGADDTDALGAFVGRRIADALKLGGLAARVRTRAASARGA